MNNLGLLYENGYGVEKNLAEAANWYKRAAEKGDENAPNNLQRVNKQIGKNSSTKGFFSGLFKK